MQNYNNATHALSHINMPIATLNERLHRGHRQRQDISTRLYFLNPGQGSFSYWDTRVCPGCFTGPTITTMSDCCDPRKLCPLPVVYWYVRRRLNTKCSGSSLSTCGVYRRIAASCMRPLHIQLLHTHIARIDANWQPA